MINIILCGGSGARLWPLSRTILPKQFVRLFDGRSLFQDTVIRNQTVCTSSFIVSNQNQYFLAVDQLVQISSAPVRFLLEPVGRNTAPAIALACLSLNENDLVLVTTSDHLVKDQAAYEVAILEAKALAEQDNLVTFGIKPIYPETGFGYIEADKNSSCDVLSFKEKPDELTAQVYLDKGNYYWNSGMFCFKAGVFLAELQKHEPDMFQACVNLLKTADSEGGSVAIYIEAALMQAIPEGSIDYVVMEKSDRVKVVVCDMGWSDLGSYDALYDEVRTEQTNAILPRLDNSPEPICIDSNNNLIVTQDRTIALVNINDLLIVDTSDALLISKKGSSQKVKDVVAQIKKQAPELAEIHSLVHRLWGTYEVLQSSEQYKVKRIVVKPGCKLSLQKHFHRNEHWIVVSETATVTVDEAQVGEYTGEDDIVRIEDVYQRR